MATQNGVNVFTNDEKKLVLKALNTLHASVLRARNKPGIEQEEYEMYDKRLRAITALTNKELP